MNADFFAQMEAYLDGQLSRAELEAGARAAGINNVDAELAWLRQTRLAVEAEGLKQQLQQQFPSTGKREARVRSIWPRWAAAAAAVLVLAVAGWWWAHRSSVPELYAEYEFVDPGIPVLMSDTQDYELQNALSFYSEERYDEAIIRLEALRSDTPGNDTLIYYLGASYLYTGQTAAAAPLLENIADTDNSAFAQRAQWLRVLLALREKDREAAGKRAHTIADTPGHLFTREAQQLQEDLSTQ